MAKVQGVHVMRRRRRRKKEEKEEEGTRYKSHSKCVHCKKVQHLAKSTSHQRKTLQQDRCDVWLRTRREQASTWEAAPPLISPDPRTALNSLRSLNTVATIRFTMDAPASMP